MRTDRLYLADIVAAADSIGRFIADMGDDAAFYTDDLRQSAILQKLIVIGEAASRPSRELCEAHPEIEWADIIFVMEKSHRDKVAKKFKELLVGKKLVCLDIPDEYDRMDPALVRLLEAGVAKHVRLR